MIFKATFFCLFFVSAIFVHPKMQLDHVAASSDTHPKFNIAPEKSWLEDYLLFGGALHIYWGDSVYSKPSFSTVTGRGPHPR